MMHFNLFGVDIMPKDKIYGIWLFMLQLEYIERCLFSVYYAEGHLFIELFFVRFKNGRR